jgi:hypothetical protein
MPAFAISWKGSLTILNENYEVTHGAEAGA